MGSLVGCINEPRPTLKIPSAERRKEPLSTREKVGSFPLRRERESLSIQLFSLLGAGVPGEEKGGKPGARVPRALAVACLTYLLSLSVCNRPRNKGMLLFLHAQYSSLSDRGRETKRWKSGKTIKRNLFMWSIHTCAHAYGCVWDTPPHQGKILPPLHLPKLIPPLQQT